MQINTKNYLILSIITLAGVLLITPSFFFIQNISSEQHFSLTFFIFFILTILTIIFGSAIKFFFTAIKKNIEHPFTLLFK
jgi:hypothetical protein